MTRSSGRLLARAAVATLSAGTALFTVASGVGVLSAEELSPTRVVATDREPSVVEPDHPDASTPPERGPRSARPTPPEAAPEPDEPSEEPEQPEPDKPDDEPEEEPTEPDEVPTRASGELNVVDSGGAATRRAERVIDYRVEVEDGLGFDGAQVAAFVHQTLLDDRGWSGVHDVTFQQTDAEDAEVRIILASPNLTDELCLPLDTGGRLSCRVDERVVMNAQRWAEGIPDYGNDLADYRRYLINHEVGHALGYDHASCPAPGAPAPVMMQQTKGLEQCRPNPWPTVAADD